MYPEVLEIFLMWLPPLYVFLLIYIHMIYMICGVSSDLDGCRGALKREVFFFILSFVFLSTSSNQHLLVVGC